MKKTFKYRLYPTKAVSNSAVQILDLCRIVYNLCLEQRQHLWQYHRKSISCFDQVKQLPELKKAFPEFNKVPSQTLQDVVERVDRAFQGFFRRIKAGEKPGYPRFKSPNRYHSFTLKQAGWKLSGNILEIRKIGKFKIILHRPIEGKVKTVTVKRSLTGKWFALFCCDNVPIRPLPKTGKALGVDVGCENFLVTSDGLEIPNPRFLKRQETKLEQRQKRLSRKVKGSNRRLKAKRLIARIHEKLVNQRTDFHFKVANQLVKIADIIYMEKLKAWTSWRALNKSMRDAAWFNFFSCLRAKAEEAGREIREVPARDTSQICSGCGKTVQKELSDRRHVCPFCHLSISRDHNAARNILRLGASLRENQSSLPSREALGFSPG
ncbi:MAG: RNA-guided endonuclease InsQ/TnpB family protein [Candidatus Aminicenantales bacterium]